MARKKIKKKASRKSYTIRPREGESLVLTAKDPVAAAVKAVNLFAMKGIVPTDLGHVAPTAPLPGYEFLVALTSDVQQHARFEADHFAGYRDETGELSPCCGAPGTFAIELGRWLVENEEAA